VTLSGGNEVEAITQNLSGMGYVYGDGVREDILRMVPPDGHVIGSIGCGKGATEAVLVGQGREVHGVDIAPEAVALARERLTSARLIAPDDRRPFAPASLDGLILADVLEHVPRAWDALRAYAQAVRPGGWVIISVPNHRSFYAAWQYAVRGDWPEQPVGLFDTSHIQFMTRRRLTRWCQSAGLRVVAWVNTWGPYGWNRNRWLRLLNLVTLGLLREWLQYQIQIVCRKASAQEPVAAPGQSPEEDARA
jgi:SAM-dependent methyltransferase